MATQLIDKKTALAELCRIRNKSSVPRAFAGVKKCIEDIFNRRKLPFEIESPMGLVHEFYINGLWGLVPDEEKDAYRNLEKALDALLTARGYREDIMTYQEHQLCGSTEWIAYAENPYVPLGMIRDKEGKETLTLEETMGARELQPFQSCFGVYWDQKNGNMVVVTREPLDNEGRTVRDPRVIDVARLSDALRNGMPLEQAFDACVIPFTKSPDFPFRRD